MPRMRLAGTALIAILAGLLLSYHAYFTPAYAFNPYQAGGSVVFWGGVLLLGFALFLQKPAALAARYVKSPVGAVIGGTYLVAHLLLYGFVLEGILVLLYRIPPFVPGSAVYLSSDTLYPASLANALVGLAFSPNVNIQLPPIFELSLSAFSFAVAVVVDTLILANVAKVKEIGVSSWISRSRAYVFMPAAGILLGASCCMSLPFLLSFVSPSLADAAAYGWAYFVTYFFLPVLGIVVLKVNLDLASRVAANAARLGSSDRIRQ